MVRLNALIQFLRPDALAITDYLFNSDTPQGISYWNAQKLGTQPTPAEIAAAELPAAKAATIAANRAECSNRIYARYPAGRQLSALAGIYDAANVSAMHDWIASCIAAENTAADLIEAATTVQAVEAVTVAWPV